MKYLRNFNESVISLRDELHDFCVDNLVWLIDEGFEIKTFAGGSNRRGYTITINKPYEEPSFLPLREFKWTDIQDIFIQFIDRLSNFNTNLKIDIIELTTYPSIREYKITTQDLLQNNVERIEDLRNIVEVKIEISNSGKNTINKIKLYEDYINTNRFLYHKASPLVREYILKNGITPREKSAAWLSNTPIEGKATFASNSENKEEWFDTTYDDDIWKIDNSVANVKWKEDPNFIQGETAYVYTQEFIKPEALQLIYKGTGKDNF